MARSTGLRLSPGVKVFLAVDLVLVLVFVVLLATNRPSGDPVARDSSSSSRSSESPSSAGDPSSPQDESGPEESPSPEETDQEPLLFASPSGNIQCSVTAEAASCTISSVADGALIEDESCEGTVGHLVRVDSTGEAERPCLLDDPPRKAPKSMPVLDYEESEAAFGFTCTSSRSGIICRHEETGHGFSVARAGSSLF